MSSSNKSASMKRRLVLFSAVLFLLIFVVCSTAFVLSMRQILRKNADAELTKLLEIERIKLEASVNGEIAIALKMASSPLIQDYFANPDNEALSKVAVKEIGGYRRAFAGNTAFWISDIDKKFYSDDAYVYTVDPKDPSQYWYSMTLNETDKFNFNINYNDQLKKIMLWINAVVKNNGKPSGIVGTGIDLSAFTEAIYKNYSNKASLYFFNGLGEITGAKNLSLITEKKKIEDEFGAMGAEVMAITKNIKPGETKFFAGTNGQIAISAVPVLNWYAIAVMPSSIDDYKTAMTWIFLAMLTLIALIFVVFNAFIFTMVKPLLNMVKALNQTSMDWDLTRRLEIQRNDEIGSVASSVNDFFEKIRSILKDLHLNSTSITSSSEKLSMVSKSLSAGAADTVAQSKMVSDTSGQMTVNINSMASGAEQASVNASEVASAAEEMSMNMSTVASAIEEMSASISQIASNTVEMSRVASAATGKATDATNAMSKLGSAAKEIGQVTDVIKKIADKTNLLALNATIEAASAGEAGKGFAVVAGEIKELANQSAKSADDISHRIEGIQAGTNNAVGVINEVSGIIAQINQSVEDIAGHIDQQTKVSNEIANNVAQANTGSKRVAGAIGEVAKGVRDVSCNASEAARGAGDVNDNVMNMNKAANESLRSVSQVNESAGDLLRIAGELNKTVGQFRV
ncbi:MAG: methyl-accepting chemotaxis protein [Fibromonadales bacterium]|nr:methyl-accepting chemotaxis protein [Fibromonadales bacterium]